MELRHLRYFVTVAEELHFGRAAERLQMAQQPLSSQIRRLEDELGVILFHRTTRRVELTDTGRSFLEKARETLQLAEEAIEAAREAERGERGKIVVGYVSTTLYNVLPRLVRTFSEAFPNIRVTLRELCSPELEQRVIDGDLDVGLTGTAMGMDAPLRDDRLDTLPLHQEPFVVVLPENHPLAAYSEIPVRALSGQPFIQYDYTEKRDTYEGVVNFCRREGISLNVVQEATTEQALIGLAAAGVGVSVVCASLAGLRQTEVVYRRLIDPSVDVQFDLIWRCETPSPVIRSFIQAARTQALMSADTDLSRNHARTSR